MTADAEAALLVRRALTAAGTWAERAAVRRAVVEATDEMRAQLRKYWSTKRRKGGFDPIAIARQHAIRELRAAAIDASMPPASDVAYLDAGERRTFEEELASARQQATVIVRRSLRPPPPA